MVEFDKKYAKYISAFNQQMNFALSTLCAPNPLKNAMVYAVGDGGKRVRPVLCFATAEILGVPMSEVKEFAFAIECVHSYSLVHDDLPAMDNDDYRRGKLSTHKKFGEAIGVLTGDALLNFAFEHCLSKPNFNQNCVRALGLLAEYSGSIGMIKGQVLDLSYENSTTLNQEALYEIYENKTAKLLTLPLLIASIMADGAHYDSLEVFGRNLGIMFQITDDIMDVEGSFETIGKTPHKDEKLDKLTSVKVFGLDGAKEKCKIHYENCLRALSKIENSDFLKEFTDKIYSRKS